MLCECVRVAVLQRERERERTNTNERLDVWNQVGCLGFLFCFVLFRFVYFLVPVLYRWRRFSGREVRYEVGWFSSAVESDDQVKR